MTAAQVKGRTHLVFEYVERTVLEALKRHPRGLGSLPTRRIVWQLVSAMQYLHSQKARARTHVSTWQLLHALFPLLHEFARWHWGQWPHRGTAPCMGPQCEQHVACGPTVNGTLHGAL